MRLAKASPVAKDVVQDFNEALARHFRQRLAHRLSEDVAICKKFAHGDVRHFVDMVGTAQHAHEIARLHEQAIEMVGGGEKRVVEDLDHFEPARNAAPPRFAVLLDLGLRLAEVRDVLRVLHQKRDLPVGAKDRDMRAAPGAIFRPVCARNRIMQHGQNIGDAEFADALE